MSASPEQPHSFSPEEIAQRIEHFGATFGLDVMKQAASLIRAQSERERVLVEALHEMLEAHSLENVGVGASLRRTDAKKRARAALKAAP